MASNFAGFIIILHSKISSLTALCGRSFTRVSWLRVGLQFWHFSSFRRRPTNQTSSSSHEALVAVEQTRRINTPELRPSNPLHNEGSPWSVKSGESENSSYQNLCTATKIFKQNPLLVCSFYFNFRFNPTRTMMTMWARWRRVSHSSWRNSSSR